MRTISYHKNTDEDVVHLENLAYVLLMPILIDFLSIIIQQNGASSSSNVTMAFYVISLLVILVRLMKRTPVETIIKDVGMLIILYMIFALNYLLFPSTQKYLLSKDMLIVYVFFMPIGLWSVGKIKKWEPFYRIMLKPGIVAMFLASLILIFFDYQKYLVYMGFSYALLPFICVFYYLFRTQPKKKIWYILLFIVGLTIILIFGARAVVGFCVVYIIVFEITRTDISLQIKVLSIFVLGTIAIVLTTNLDYLARVLLKLSVFKNSYFLTNLVQGKLYESNTRDVLYEMCENRVNSVGLEVSGFFGDRAYCTDFAYPHNIIYEIIMSFGWGMGLVLIGLYIVLVLKCLKKKDNYVNSVTLFTVITLFLRYFISGSYLIEGRFWILLFMLIALSHSQSTQNKQNITITDGDKE